MLRNISECQFYLLSLVYLQKTPVITHHSETHWLAQYTKLSWTQRRKEAAEPAASCGSSFLMEQTTWMMGMQLFFRNLLQLQTSFPFIPQESQPSTPSVLQNVNGVARRKILWRNSFTTMICKFTHESYHGCWKQCYWEMKYMCQKSFRGLVIYAICCLCCYSF